MTQTHTECLSVFVASLTNVNLDYVRILEYLSLYIDRMDINNTMMEKGQKWLLAMFTKLSKKILWSANMFSLTCS